MNLEQLEGKWDQVKGQIKEKWGKLTDDDLTAINGKKEKLLGKMRERYGLGKEEAERQLGAFAKDCNCESEAPRKNQEGKPRSQPTV